MVCKNCGAQYSDEKLQCPYCHTENRRIALRRKKEILKDYDKEADAIRARAELYPKEAANKWTGITLRILCVAAVLGVIVVAVMLVWNKYSVKYQYEKGMEHTQNLETLFLAEDYEGIRTYMQEEDIWNEYPKYYQVANAYKQYRDMKESAERIRKTEEYLYDTREDWEILNAYDIDHIMDCAVRLADGYEEYGKDTVFLGNEDALEKFYLAAVKELEKYGFTEEEIEGILLGDENPRQQEMYKKLEDYFWE